MSVLIKVGFGVLLLVFSLVTLSVAFFVWQHKSETKRIAENYGEHYLKMIKEHSRKSQRVCNK